MAAADGRRDSGSSGDVLEFHGDGGYADKLVRWRSLQIQRRADFRGQDRGDIAQELWLDLIQRFPKFDPTRASLRTFIQRVVDHRVSTLIRSRRRELRHGARMESLQDTARDEDGAPAQRWQTLSLESHRARAGASDSEAANLRDLRIDLKAGLKSLPADVRDLARWLTYHSPSEASRVAGVPRTTLYKRMKRVRAHLARAGLAKYLPGAGSDPRARG